MEVGRDDAPLCGIAGFIGAPGPDQYRVDAASKILRHRGPDGEGFYSSKAGNAKIVLVHRRLSIIDLHNRSNQPFEFDGGVLVFNGEIYNFPELRSDLRNLGHKFRTEGDTEVLAHALRQWGAAAQERLEGMWAFAWFDERSGKLLLSRDRFGEKPLHLWNQKEGLYFSSEVKGLSALAGRTPAINEDHLMRSLVNGYRSLYQTRETFFDGVEELPPGTSLEIGPGASKSPRPFWTPSVEENAAMSYAEAVAGSRERIIGALRLRMRSDVPVAFAMSGGVDSNTLIATASRVLGADVHGFTIVNTDQRYEEKGLVDLAVDELGIKHTAVKLSQKDFLPTLRGLVRSHDGPIATISYYVHWQLMRSISEAGYKVTISGIGADELFTGYYSHHNLYLYEMAKYPEMYKSALAAWHSYQSQIVRNPYLKNPRLFIEDPAFRGYVNMNSELFSSFTTMGWREQLREKTYSASLLRDRMLNELFAETVPVMLHEDDLNAMSFSIENRSPFLDSALFDWAYTIPAKYLIRDGRAKAVLRDAMGGIVPNRIIESRRKVGFNAPISDLLDLSDEEVRSSILDGSPIFDKIRKGKIEEVLTEKQMPNSVSMFLFRFLNAKLFLEEYESARGARA